MIRKTIWFCVAAMLFLTPVLSFAGGSTCAAATGLVPDGSVLDLDYVQANSTVWYSFNTVAGRSYSVVVRDDLDGNPGNDLQIAYYSSNCATQMTATPGTSYNSSQYRDTTALEPKLVYGQRVSIPAPNADTIAIKVANTNLTSGHYVSVSVTETTLYSTHWSSYTSGPTPPNVWGATFNFNSTQASATISGTLTLRGDAGQTYGPISVTLSPSSPGQYLRTDLDFKVPTNQSGNAIFAYDGPPGSVMASTFEFNPTYTSFVVGRFEPLHRAH